MHKGVVLLVKAESLEDARSYAESFLEEYGNGDVWDWYEIGGRWSGMLDPRHYKYSKLVSDKKKEKFPEKEGLDLDFAKLDQEEYDALWIKAGGEPGTQYNDSMFNSIENNIKSLSECLDIVKEYNTPSIKDKAIEYWDKMIEAKNEEIEKELKGMPTSTMSAYYAGLYRDCKYDSFSFEQNVFDTDSYSSEIPEDITDMWAVVVDMHN